MDACPSPHLIPNKDLLTDKGLQTSIFKNPQRKMLGKLQKEQFDMLHLLKKAQDEGVPFSDDLRAR
eukprot:5659501-Prorocentrum_lima.AAC.1